MTDTPHTLNDANKDELFQFLSKTNLKQRPLMQILTYSSQKLIKYSATGPLV